jgi:flagellar motor switch protein FliG
LVLRKNSQGAKKAAKLLASLDADSIVEICKHLSPDDIRKLAKEITLLPEKERKEIERILIKEKPQIAAELLRIWMEK